MRLIHRLRIGATLLLAALFLSPAQAMPDDRAIARQAEAVLADFAKPEGPGAVVLIARGDTTIYRAARGLADIELGVKLQPDQVFRIASITKMFTGALVVKLAEDGKLSLDDPVSKFLPDLPNGGAATIRQLLSHTAGISDQRTDAQRGLWRRDIDTATQVAEIGVRPLAFASGSDQRYSNSGFILLGAVIEKVTGKPWHAALKEQILDPLGLSRTDYGATSRIVPGRVTGYSSDFAAAKVNTANYISLTIPAAAGGLISTADDLRTWMRALVAGRVVSPAGFAAMTKAAVPGNGPPRDPYGLGMYLWSVRGAQVIGHSGQIDGFTSTLVYIPSADTTIVVLANDDNLDAQGVMRRLAAIALGKPYPVPVAVPVPAAQMQAIAGSYRIDVDQIQTISIQDGKLHARRGNRNPLPLQMTATGELHFERDELTYFVPVRGANGAVEALDYFAKGDDPAKRWPRIAAATP